jgi:hypothetical protein
MDVYVDQLLVGRLIVLIFCDFRELPTGATILQHVRTLAKILVFVNML